MTQKQIITQNKIQIPVQAIIEGRELNPCRLDLALEALKEVNYRPASLPEIAAARIKAHQDGNLEPWHKYYDSGSLRAWRTFKSGYPLVVTAHMPNYITQNPKILREAIEQRKLIDGTLELPDEVFDELISLDGTSDSFGNRDLL